RGIEGVRRQVSIERRPEEELAAGGGIFLEARPAVAAEGGREVRPAGGEDVRVDVDGVAHETSRMSEGGGAVGPRGADSTGRRTEAPCRGRWAMSFRSSVAAVAPTCSKSTMTVASAGAGSRGPGRPARPAMERSAGTRRPSFCAAAWAAWAMT